VPLVLSFILSVSHYHVTDVCSILLTWWLCPALSGGIVEITLLLLLLLLLLLVL